jgi:hypothetical protein
MSELEKEEVEAKDISYTDMARLLAQGVGNFVHEHGLENYAGSVYTLTLDKTGEQFEVFVGTQRVGAKTAHDLLQEAKAEIEQLKVELAEKSAIPELYTCIGKGGAYARIGTAIGAGLSRGQSAEVYRDIATAQLYFREPEDFSNRMDKLATTV